MVKNNGGTYLIVQVDVIYNWSFMQLKLNLSRTTLYACDEHSHTVTAGASNTSIEIVKVHDIRTERRKKERDL